MSETKPSEILASLPTLLPELVACRSEFVTATATGLWSWRPNTAVE